MADTQLHNTRRLAAFTPLDKRAQGYLNFTKRPRVRTR